MQNLPVLRVFEGHDTHRTVKGRQLMLGGVAIESEFGLDGHSDADVLLHAVTDTLLGALALGDIGDWFPNTDPQWKGADSAVFLREAVNAVQERGWSIANLDCTIFAERPKLAPWRKQIQENLAELLGIAVDQVNLKAKTGENVGPIGRGESISADAVVLLFRDDTTG